MSVTSIRWFVTLFAGLAATATVAAQVPSLTPGTRVRVHTIAYTLELPGVRIEPNQITGSVLSQDADTITVRVTGEGPRILPRAGRRIVGFVVADRDRTLSLGRSDGSTVIVPREAIGKVERSAGRRSRGRNILWGLLVGAGGGSAMGAATYSCDAPTGWGPCFGPGVAAGAGAILGGGLGAAAGVFVRGQERWSEVVVGRLP
jgi:hypothetical protein